MVPLDLQKKFHAHIVLTANRKVMSTTNKQAVTVLQLMHEADTWKRILEFIQGENVYLKNRLAEVTREITDSKWLEQAEYFQNHFVVEDSAIVLLRHDLVDLEAWLRRELIDDGAIIKEIRKRHKKLREEIELTEQRFNRLKFEFNHYLSDIL
jgi:hypothetical protein